MTALRTIPALLVVLACQSLQGQTIRYVDDDASTNGDGASWETAYKYLQDALFEATGDPSISEIRVAGGTYKPDGDEGGSVTPGDREATFQLLDGVAIKGGYRGCPAGDCGGCSDHDEDTQWIEGLSE